MGAIFTVTPKGTRWCIERAGQELGSHVSKDTVVMKARLHAIKHAPSTLVVYDLDKAQEHEWHYG